MNYLMQMAGSSVTLQWELRFDSASDEMAKEFARGSLLRDAAAKPADRIYLFNVTQDTCIATFVFDRPTVREVC